MILSARVRHMGVREPIVRISLSSALQLSVPGVYFGMVVGGGCQILYSTVIPWTDGEQGRFLVLVGYRNFGQPQVHETYESHQLSRVLEFIANENRVKW